MRDDLTYCTDCGTAWGIGDAKCPQCACFRTTKNMAGTASFDSGGSGDLTLIRPYAELYEDATYFMKPPD